MATERLSMRKIREILRLKWVLGRSHREIARATGVGVGTVSEVAWRARTAGIDSWVTVEAMDEPTLEARLYPSLATTTARSLPDPVYLAKELRRPGVTLRLLHVEYMEQTPGGYGYTQFCERYRAWQRRRKLTMRQVHRAGDKAFIDYSGKKPSIVDPTSGERVEVELFVAVLGASNYTYAEATRTQRVRGLRDRSHVRALASSVASPAPSCPTSFAAPSASRVATSPERSAPTRSWPSTTARRSCRRGRPSRATRRWSRSLCRSRSAGSWPGCATTSSSRWRS